LDVQKKGVFETLILIILIVLTSEIIALRQRQLANRTFQMALTPSTMLPLATLAPHFQLPDTDGKFVSLEDLRDSPALVVAFLCSHCPYVKHVRHGFARLAKQYQGRGVAFVGINSNDASQYTDDRPELMGREREEAGYAFPYLYDESQEVARAYNAACTPDFYLFDKSQKLVYRGQIDSSRPGNSTAVTGKDLSAALDALLSGRPIDTHQYPSVGCNIKWKSGNRPHHA
jgi:peroxiredoxin